MGSHSMPSRTVVVTGFGPFGDHKVNASWECVKRLQEMTLGDDVMLFVHELPVVYTTVKKTVSQIWADHKPDLVVHVGVSGSARELTLEQMARNTGYHRVDVDGCPADGLCCVDGAEDCISSGIDMALVCQELNEADTKVKSVISTDAGRYLCDFFFLLSLHIDRNRCAFVHVPPLDTPYTVHELADGLRIAILSMLKQVDQLTGSRCEYSDCQSDLNV